MLKHPLIPFFALVVLAVLMLFQAACSDDDLTDDPSDLLTFSTDTLGFDTIFVTMGSITRDFKVYNPNASRVRLQSVRLGKGSDSPFRMNIDGESRLEFNNVEIWADDSIHVFLELTIDPNDEQLPFVVEDSVIFEYNGNVQDVQLVGFGQNAHFFGPYTPNGYQVGSTQDTTWTNDLPYVIYGGIVIDENHKLTIEKGCRIHLHNSALIYAEGTLSVNGEADTLNKVTFQGTRLDKTFPYDYSETPGQWLGIYIAPQSRGSRIRNAIVQNAYNGIVQAPVEEASADETPNLVVENTIIRNMYQFGIWNRGGKVVVANSLLYNCGVSNLAMMGGNNILAHCTFANYSGGDIDRRNPIIYATNYFDDGDAYYLTSLKASFLNCVVIGEKEEEFELLPYDASGIGFAMGFQNCMVRTKLQDVPIWENCIFPTNFNNIYADRSEDNYSLPEGSPAIDAGLDVLGIDPGGGGIIYFDKDLTGKVRTAPYDIGAFEY